MSWRGQDNAPGTIFSSSEGKRSESKIQASGNIIKKAGKIQTGSIHTQTVPTGIFELFGWDGQLKWQYRIADHQQHAHHDMAVLPNGHFLVCVWERHSEAEAQSKGRKYPGEVWSERILELSNTGTQQADIIWQWSAWDHLIQDVDPTKPNYGTVAD